MFVPLQLHAMSNAYWMVSENHGGAPAFVR